MKIHINQIPATGLHVEGEEERDILDLNDPAVKPLGTVRYNLDVGLSDGGLFATGSLEADVQMECVTCLEPFEYRVEVPDFAMQIDLPSTELVDLTEEVREDILLALPPYPHCDWNGKKACAGLRKIRTKNAKNVKNAENERNRDHSTGQPNGQSGNEPVERNPWTTLDQLNQLTKPKE